jgi:hypothetical protein
LQIICGTSEDGNPDDTVFAMASKRSNPNRPQNEPVQPKGNTSGKRLGLPHCDAPETRSRVPANCNPLEILRDSVMRYDHPTEPADDWGNAP